MQSSIYYDIDESKRQYSDLITRIRSYADSHNMDVFILTIPKSDLNEESYQHDGCFMVMSFGFKIALINSNASNEEYGYYCEDVREVMNYLFQKYEYRGELGRFSSWANPLIVDNLTLQALNNLDDFWAHLQNPVFNPKS